MTDERHIGERLATWRKLWGISQRELARRAAMTNGALSQIEQGNTSPSVQTLQKLAFALGLSLEHFMFGAQRNPLQTMPAREAKVSPLHGGRLYEYPLDSGVVYKLLIPVGAEITEEALGSLLNADSLCQLYVSAGVVALSNGGLQRDLAAGDMAQILAGAGLSIVAVAEDAPSECLLIPR